MQHEIRPADSQDVRWDDFAIAPQGGMLAIGAVDNQREGNAQREVSVEVWNTRSSDSANALLRLLRLHSGKRRRSGQNASPASILACAWAPWPALPMGS